MRPPTLNLDEYLPYLVNRVGVALALRFGKDALARYGLSIEMWRVLVVLSNNGGQRQVDLGGLTSIDASTLSRMVTRLSRLGLVGRRRSATDNREVEVALTAKGRAALRRLVPTARRFEAVAAAGISRAELADLKRALRLMYRNLALPQG
ncbi:MAG: MarR family transcriptional regulator [Alphaproteobacteria bacterium]|nr:MarR family transcriptional regulator [Alphaproteobacteria bacterium]